MKLKLKLGIFLLLALSAVVFNACKKESKDEVSPTTTNPGKDTGTEPTGTNPTDGDEETKKRAFKFKVKVKKDQAMTIYTDNSTYKYNYQVDWGDGTVQKDITKNVNHKFTKAGELIVSINGEYPHIYFAAGDNSSDVNISIIAVTQWGDNEWKSMHEMFNNCNFLTDILAEDKPNLSKVTDMSKMFAETSRFNGNIGDWDVSSVKNMNKTFAGAYQFNQPLNGWNVNNVTDMSGMFYDAHAFNQPLNDWGVSNVTDMSGMFQNASSFNQPLNKWSVSSVTDMSYMFYAFETSSFNQPLNDWGVSSVKNMEGMFSGAYEFNQPLNNWDVSSVTNYDSFAKYSALECKHIPNGFDDKAKAQCSNP